MTETDLDDGEFKTEAAALIAAALAGQQLQRRRTSWTLLGDDIRWVLTIDRVPHLAQVHVMVGLDFDRTATTSANYCPVVTSAAAVADSLGLDRSQLDWALRGSTPMGWPERRTVVATTIEAVVAFLRTLGSVAAVRAAYRSGALRLGPMRPDVRAFLEGDAERWPAEQQA